MDQSTVQKAQSTFRSAINWTKTARRQSVDEFPESKSPIFRDQAGDASSLSPERKREYQLISKIQKYNDAAAANKMMQNFVPLIKSVAYGFSGYGVDLEELQAEGRIALFLAFQKFDMFSGVAFSTYAKPLLHWAMVNFIINNVRVMKFATSKPRRKLFFRYPQMVKEYGTSKEGALLIAAKLDVPIDDVIEVAQYYASRDCSMQSFIGSTDDSGVTLQDSLTGSKSPEDEVIKERELNAKRKYLELQISKLPQRTQEILRARHYVEPPVSLAELGERFGVSGSRIEQIEKNAIKALKNAAMEFDSGKARD